MSYDEYGRGEGHHHHHHHHHHHEGGYSESESYGCPPQGRFADQGGYGQQAPYGQGPGDGFQGGQGGEYGGRPEGGYGERPPFDSYGQGGGGGRPQGGYGDQPPYGSGAYDGPGHYIGGRPQGGQGYGGGGAGNDGYYDDNGDDFGDAVSHARRHHGGDEGDSSLYSNAVSSLQSRRDEYINPDSFNMDHQQMIQNHQSLYGGGGPGGDGRQHDANSLGQGAAMQALKMFSSGQCGGGGQNEFIGLAMAQAGKLFDQMSGEGNVTGDKQSAIMSAAENALKMYMSSKGGGMGGTGGPAELMGLASKFF